MTDTPTSVIPVGYDPDGPDADRHAYAAALLAEAKALHSSVERFVLLISTIKENRLYEQLGHKSFEDFVLKEFGVSRSTGNRWISQAKALKELPETAESTKPQVSASRVAGQTASEAIEVPARPSGPRVSQRAATKKPPTRRTMDQPPDVIAPDKPIKPAPEPKKKAPEKPKGEAVETLPSTAEAVAEVVRPRQEVSAWFQEGQRLGARKLADFLTIEELTATKHLLADTVKLTAVVPSANGHCLHPKAKRRQLSYGPFCDECKTIIR